MSFASRMCMQFFNRGVRLLTNVTGGAPTQLPQPARSFHMLLASSTSPLGVEAAGVQRLLAPLSAMVTQVAGFKVRARLRRRCKDCYFVTRQERLHIICPTHPRHKQMAMKKRDYKSWILTHATQSKIRPF